MKDCKVFSTGLVALLQNSQLVTTHFASPQPRLLASPSHDEQILSWALIPPQPHNRHVEVLLATRNTILVADQLEIQDQLLQQGPFSYIALSPNSKFLALYTNANRTGRIWVVYSDFQKGISDFTIPASGNENDGALRQLVWVGNDAVAVSWEGGRVLIIGPTGGYLEYYYNQGVWMVEDIDGLRIYSSNKCELLQKVPGITSRWCHQLRGDVSRDTFKIGSTAPAAVLVDAVDHLERNSAKADEAIRLIRPNLADAVDGCIKAAGYEWDPYWQKRLLKVLPQFVVNFQGC